MKSDAVDLVSKTIRIMGKGKKERYLQICNEEVIQCLNDYYDGWKEEIEETGYFFVNIRGRQLSEQSIREMIKKYVSDAGLSTEVRPHMF